MVGIPTHPWLSRFFFTGLALRRYLSFHSSYNLLLSHALSHALSASHRWCVSGGIYLSVYGVYIILYLS